MARHDSFESFLEQNPQFLADLRQYCVGRTRSRQAGTSEICFEEAVESLCKNWTGISKPPMIYAKSVVRRFAGKQPALNVEQQMESPPDVASDLPDVGELLDEVAQRKAIQNIVRNLALDERKIIYVVCYRSASIREAARILGMRPSTLHDEFKRIIGGITKILRTTRA